MRVKALRFDPLFFSAFKKKAHRIILPIGYFLYFFPIILYILSIDL